MNTRQDLLQVLKAAGAKFDKNGKVKKADVSRVLAGLIDSLASVEEVASNYTSEGCETRFLCAFHGAPGLDAIQAAFCGNADKVAMTLSEYLLNSGLPFESVRFNLQQATNTHAWVDACFVHRKKPFLPMEAIKSTMDSLFMMTDKATF